MLARLPLSLRPLSRLSLPRSLSVVVSTSSPSAPAFGVTDSCARRVEKLCEMKGEEVHLRVAVDAGGCSGFQYEFEVEPRSLQEPSDITITHNSQTVVVDPASVPFLRGAKVDFVEEMIRSGFAVVDNPNSESACGCGSSFALKNFEENKPE
ncbi:hypothetical protein TeGR_g6073 [Tetraparma gracilis]|uniref:Core domain-containing protein n=1 Tax=Tetraparma gracilis TaxID=2962635 RepID=A0ABQ6MXE0_9STRA|nr:hypothetical protein TeGR_g6073 [Tetraparma gracilis]